MSPIDRFNSTSPYEQAIGYSRVVRAGEWFVTAGCTATVGGKLIGHGDIAAQATAAINVALAALESAGCERENVISGRIYLTDRAHTEAAGRAHHELLGDVRPALTLLLVAGFVDPEMLIEVELTGYTPHGQQQ